MGACDSLNVKMQEEEAMRLFDVIYGSAEGGAVMAMERYLHLADLYDRQFSGKGEVRFFRAPGRTEICGNHTDHQRGRVIAAAISMDAIAAVSGNDDGVIRVFSEGFAPDEVDIRDLDVRTEEKNTARALVRGVAACFRDVGYALTGLDIYTTSTVLPGSGLSSSAAFEVLLGQIMNDYYAASRVSDEQIARFGQFAENVYYGKPSGLMDQMSSSIGGVVALDFADPEKTGIDRLPVDFGSLGYAIVIIDSGADHQDLTDEYAAIPREMGQIAVFFGKQFLRDVDEGDLYRNIPALRASCGDRAVLRAMHFFAEEERVEQAVGALRAGDVRTFLRLVNASGDSSWQYLQNVLAPKHPERQAVAVTLAIGKRFLGETGACRVHGGGFAGTIQAFVPKERVTTFLEGVESTLGSGRSHVMSISSVGGTRVF